MGGGGAKPVKRGAKCMKWNKNVNNSVKSFQPLLQERQMPRLFALRGNLYRALVYVYHIVPADGITRIYIYIYYVVFMVI